MSTRTKIIIISAVVIVGAVVLGYFLFFGGADDPVSLDEAVGAVTDDQTTETTETAASQPPATTSVAADPGTDAGLDGTWTLAADLDSFVGYRVQEELDPIGSATATGRTRTVDARLEIEGSTITDVFVDADVSQLESDRSMRDRALRTRGLESNQFPQAIFQLTAPIELGSVPGEGETITATAAGELTAHGVTNAVTVNLEAQLVEGVIAVIGTIEIALSDFDISGLTGFAVLSVEDEGEVEFQLLFSR